MTSGAQTTKSGIDYSRFEAIDAAERRADAVAAEEREQDRMRRMEETTKRQQNDDGSESGNAAVPFISKDGKNAVIDKLSQLSVEQLESRLEGAHNYTKRLIHATLRRKREKAAEEAYETRVAEHGRGEAMTMKRGFLKGLRKRRGGVGLYADKPDAAKAGKSASGRRDVGQQQAERTLEARSEEMAVRVVVFLVCCVCVWQVWTIISRSRARYEYVP
jgi:hypothetical protein